MAWEDCADLLAGVDLGAGGDCGGHGFVGGFQVAVVVDRDYSAACEGGGEGDYARACGQDWLGGGSG